MQSERAGEEAVIAAVAYICSSRGSRQTFGESKLYQCREIERAVVEVVSVSEHHLSSANARRREEIAENIKAHSAHQSASK